jgi:hypothetical protein
MTKAIDIAPEYKYSYEVARKILEAKPDKDFEKYVNEMEEKFIK